MDIARIIESLGENREEVLRKAAQCKSAEALLMLAKENGVGITAEDAVRLFKTMNAELSELTEDELDAVAGGGSKFEFLNKKCERCDRPICQCICLLNP